MRGSSSRGHLPGHAAVAVVVEVELVHHHVGRVELGPLTQRHVGQDFGRAADDRSVGVDAGVAGQHAHVLGAEGLAPLEELLAGERLDRRGVEGADAFAQRLEVKRQRHQRLARARGRGEHHVVPGHQLEERLLLLRVGLDSAVADPAEEAVEDRLGIRDPTLGNARDERLHCFRHAAHVSAGQARRVTQEWRGKVRASRRAAGKARSLRHSRAMAQGAQRSQR